MKLSFVEESFRESDQAGQPKVSHITIRVVRGDQAYFRWGVKRAVVMEYGLESREVMLSRDVCLKLAKELTALSKHAVV